MAGQAIFEIGRRLNHVRDVMKYGDWDKWCEKDLGFTRQHANRFIRIAERFSNGTSMLQLGVAALEQLVDFTDEQIERPHTIPSSGEQKTVDEMTVRELREVKKALQEAKKQADQAKRSEEIALKKLEAAENKPPEVIEKEIIKEVVPADYDKIKGGYSVLKSSETFYKEQNETLRNEIKQLEGIIKQKKVHEVEDVDIKSLKQQKESLEQQMKSTVRIMDLQLKVEELINVFSPIKYSNDFLELKNNRELLLNFENTLTGIEKWCSEIKKELPNKDIIEGDFEDAK